VKNKKEVKERVEVARKRRPCKKRPAIKKITSCKKDERKGVCGTAGGKEHRESQVKKGKEPTRSIGGKSNRRYER